ncbi:hypothetical protein FA13DRAFT_1723777 [Coprinellus micaceus]|uniref:Uncharacterized protein n=1 Tax=Coprinellus micaceus TaxID=71717 RepID=A0A4Y7TZF5_COPMI|nr:hypothetical protein FA13DRAFT_1723777 [Coprinellus micaceus]
MHCRSSHPELGWDGPADRIIGHLTERQGLCGLDFPCGFESVASFGSSTWGPVLRALDTIPPMVSVVCYVQPSNPIQFNGSVAYRGILIPYRCCSTHN